MNKYKKIVISAVACLFLISVPLAVLAAATSTPSVLASDKIYDGNYINAAETINLEGSINGDVIVAGNAITINGPVAGDVIAVGRTVIIKGPIGGSVRVLADFLEIDNTVEHNVWFLAKSLNMPDSAQVGWDVNGSAGTLNIKGKVNGGITVNGNEIIIGNAVGKNVDVTLNSNGNLILLPQAKIAGNLNYEANTDSQLTKQNGAEVIGQTSRQVGKDLSTDWRSWATYAFSLLVSFFSLLVVGLVLITLVPKIVLNIKAEMMSRPWPNILRGIGYAIVVPILAVVLMFTIIGFPLGLILIPLYLVALYLTKIFAAFTVGLYLLNYSAKGKKYGGSLIWPLALGLTLIIILGAIPFLGMLIKLALTFWALGAIVAVKKEIWKEFR